MFGDGMFVGDDDGCAQRLQYNQNKAEGKVNREEIRAQAGSHRLQFQAKRKSAVLSETKQDSTLSSLLANMSNEESK